MKDVLYIVSIIFNTKNRKKRSETKQTVTNNNNDYKVIEEHM